MLKDERIQSLILLSVAQTVVICILLFWAISLNQSYNRMTNQAVTYGYMEHTGWGDKYEWVRPSWFRTKAYRVALNDCVDQ